MKLGQFTREKAMSQGLAVDDTCSPSVAYTGPRFAPNEWATVPNPREHELLKGLCKIEDQTLNPVIQEMIEGIKQEFWDSL